MEKRNHMVKTRAEERGDASHVPQHGGITQSPWSEEHYARHVQGWVAQWLDFLGRVRSQQTLEDEALWGEAKVLLAFLQPETEASWRPWHEWGYRRDDVEQTLAVLPQEWQSWLAERGLRNHSQMLFLAEAFLWRWHDSQRRKSQVAAGSSSSVVQKKPPGLRQEEDAELNQWGLMQDAGNEGAQPGMFLEREAEEPLQAWERIKGEEEMMDELIPWLPEAFEAQAKQGGGRGEQSPGPQSSTSAEDGLDRHSVLEERSGQSSTPGSGKGKRVCGTCGLWLMIAEDGNCVWCTKGCF